ncbi:hypothetical protein [Diplocloster hominis]|uniref:hypothetical protein n=1 Tax=Diplocloster hominis TaxID=3079010 RepID=UPI0031BB32D1
MGPPSARWCPVRIPELPQTTAGVCVTLDEHRAAEQQLGEKEAPDSGCGAAFTADLQGPLNRERVMRSW